MGTSSGATSRFIRHSHHHVTGYEAGNSNAGVCNTPFRPLPSYAAADIARWGFNAAALSISWQNLEPTPPTYDAVKQRLIHHYDRVALYEQVWSRPVQDVAKTYGISGVRLGKVCRTLQVPVPPRGYWARMRSGLCGEEAAAAEVQWAAA